MRISINLASRKYVNRRWANIILFLIFVLLVCLSAWNISVVRQKQVTLNELQQNTLNLQTQLQGALPAQIDPAEFERKLKVYRASEQLFKRDASYWTELLDRFESLVPNGVSLASLQPDYDKNSLKLSGRARDLEQLQYFLDNLYASSFKHIYLTSEGVIDVDDGRKGKREAVEFSITMEGVF